MSSQTPTDGKCTDRESLSDLINAHEAVDWQVVPGISVTEAASWTQRLDQARHELEASTDGR